MIDPDVYAFVHAIGAEEPLAAGGTLNLYRGMFKRRNYFSMNGHFLIVKISRSRKPFWGITKSIIDSLNELADYSLVLLTSPTEGWIFSKSQVNGYIGSRRWALREADGNYKINMPLSDSNIFGNPDRFVSKIAV